MSTASSADRRVPFMAPATKRTPLTQDRDRPPASHYGGQATARPIPLQLRRISTLVYTDEEGCQDVPQEAITWRMQPSLDGSLIESVLPHARSPREASVAGGARERSCADPGSWRDHQRGGRPWLGGRGPSAARWGRWITRRFDGSGRARPSRSSPTDPRRDCRHHRFGPPGSAPSGSPGTGGPTRRKRRGSRSAGRRRAARRCRGEPARLGRRWAAGGPTPIPAARGIGSTGSGSGRGAVAMDRCV